MENYKVAENMSDDRYWLLCMVEKLAIASFNYAHVLLNQRCEILNAYGYKNAKVFGR